MSTTTPPPIPPSNPLPPSPPPAKSSNKTLWIILGCVGGLGIFGVAILAAILIPTVGKVRETARRVADASNLRQIGMSALIFANEHDGQCPPVMLAADGTMGGNTPATIHAVAAALARDGGLNDANLWCSESDRDALGPVLSADRTSVDPLFAREDRIAWDFATGITTSMPATTPIAWTRGLREDGTWDPTDSVYGGDGGHIMFLGGNVQFFPDLRTAPLRRPDGGPTSNIREALPATARVVGAGPGTMNGAVGLAPAR